VLLSGGVVVAEFVLPTEARRTLCSDQPSGEAAPVDIYKDEHYADTVAVQREEEKHSLNTMKMGLGSIAVCAAIAYSMNRGKGALPNQLMHSRIYMQSGAIMCIIGIAAYDNFRRPDKKAASNTT